MKARHDDDDTPVIEHDSEASEVDEVRGQIEETRAELGQTVEALAARTDVKAQLKDKVAETKEQLREKQGLAAAKVADVRESVIAATPDQAREAVTTLEERVRARPAPAIFLGGLLAGWLLGKRRSR